MDAQSLKARNIALLIFFGLLLGAIPFLIAWAATPEDQVFSGCLVNVDDCNAYLSAIQQGRAGNWAFRYFFTPEDYQPQLMYLMYILIGKLAGIFGGRNIVWLHLSRIIAGLFAFLGYIFFVRVVFRQSKRLQITTWILISFGSGFGYLSLFLNRQAVSLPIDLATPEWNTIAALISSPHHILSSGLLSVFFASLILIEQNANSLKWAVVASFAGIGIGLLYPYHIPTVGLITGLWLLYIATKERKIPWRKWAQGALILTPLTTLLINYVFFARQDAYWEETFVTKHIIPAPSIWNLILGYGLLAVFAIGALIQRNNTVRKNNLEIPLVWMIVNLIILYLPIPFAGRFLLGFHIPIACLAAYFLENTLLPRVKQPQLYRKLIIWLTIPSTALFVVLVAQLAVGKGTYPYYFPQYDIEAVEWLTGQAIEEDIILANYPVGSYIPTVGNTKVFMGQMFITIDLDEKLALSQIFWNVETPQSWREDFVEEWGITYIFQGAYEIQTTGEYIELPWEIVYQENGVTIYSTD